MPTEQKIYNGIYYRVETPAEPHATYKKMLLLDFVHISLNDLCALIAHEFTGIRPVQVECLPHRGMIIRG